MTNTASDGGGAVPPVTPAPPVEPAPALDFPRQSMWWPYWQGSDVPRLERVISDLRAMGQDGVVLMGLDWGEDYALPADDVLRSYLDTFWLSGIKPVLGAWVKQLTDREAALIERGWAAGGGRWHSIVLDAEAGWVRFVRDSIAQARIHFERFMPRVKALTPALGYAPYGVPSFHQDYQFEWWNEACDFVMPQIYFSGQDDAETILDRAFRSWRRESQGWAIPLKTMIPLGNCYSEGADPAERAEYGTIALAEHGRVSWWRWPVLNPDVAVVLGSL